VLIKSTWSRSRVYSLAFGGLVNYACRAKDQRQLIRSADLFPVLVPSRGWNFSIEPTPKGQDIKTPLYAEVMATAKGTRTHVETRGDTVIVFMTVGRDDVRIIVWAFLRLVTRI
jgi:hypothetical protein